MLSSNEIELAEETCSINEFFIVSLFLFLRNVRLRTAFAGTCHYPREIRNEDATFSNNSIE